MLPPILCSQQQGEYVPLLSALSFAWVGLRLPAARQKTFSLLHFPNGITLSFDHGKVTYVDAKRVRLSIIPYESPQ